MNIVTIADLQNKYFGKIDHLDFDLLVAHVIKKSREFVMSHPEHKLSPLKIVNCKLKITRRMRDEPLAYILGHKEFYGLDFKVSPDTLIPRPETELLVELAIQETKNKKQKTSIIDVGTGSGNIIISIAKNVSHEIKFYATDISSAAIAIAKANAKIHNVNQKIKFLHGNLLEPVFENCKLKIENSQMIILANLPYLSKEIYNATLPNVKKYEPKSALYSPKEGLDHYEKLLQQISRLNPTICTIFLEISPEQKNKITKIIKSILPQSKIEFRKDLANRWRLCKIEI